MFRQGPSACGFRPAGLPEGSGLKPLSARAGARLCVSSEGVLPDSNRRPIAFHAMALPTELKTRIPTSACAPRSLRRLLGHEIRHADCLSPTGYSTECKDAGLPPEPRHSARGRSPARLALPRTTRCPSRLAMSVSRIAPPRVLSRARIPGRPKPNQCVSPILPRIACAAIPAAFQRGQEGRACLDGPNPKVRRDAMGSAPFPPLPTVIRRQAAIPAGRSRRGLSVRSKPNGRISMSGQARRRAPREPAAASPDAKRCPDTSHNPRCQRTSVRATKKPWWFSNRPELFGLIRKVRFASLPDPLSSEG